MYTMANRPSPFSRTPEIRSSSPSPSRPTDEIHGILASSEQHQTPHQQDTLPQQGLGIELSRFPSPASPARSTFATGRGSISEYSPVPSNSYDLCQTKSLASQSIESIPALLPRSTSESRFKSDPDVQNLIQKRAGEVAQWGIHW